VRLAIAWIVVALLVAAALLSVVPPATMLQVELAVLTLEESPLFLVATLLAVPLVAMLVPRRTPHLATMVVLLAASALVDMRPFLSAQRVIASGLPRYSARRALFGDASRESLDERRVPYAAADSSPLELLLFRAAGVEDRRPTMIVVYGGAWRGGSPVQAIDVSRYFARRGYVVVAVDYRHAPQHPFPAQIDDVRRSLVLVRDSAAAWDIDTARVAIVGRSAGGHLALLAAYAPRDPRIAAAEPLTARAVVAYYAPFDLAEAYDDLPSPDPIDVRHVLRDLIGGSPSELPLRYREASPSSELRAGLPRTLLVYAGRDHLVLAKFGREASAELRNAADNVAYVELPWAEHGFDLLPNGMGSQIALAILDRFLATALTESPSRSAR